jgi:hypothetical protein
MIRNKLRAIFASMCLELPSSTNDFSDFEDDEVQVRRHVKVTPSYPENTLMGLPTELRLMIYEFVLHDVVKKEVIRAYPAPITDATVLGTEPKRPSRHSTLLGSLALPHICCIVRQESLDVYTRLLKKHERSVWQLLPISKTWQRRLLCLGRIDFWTRKLMLTFTGVRSEICVGGLSACTEITALCAVGAWVRECKFEDQITRAVQIQDRSRCNGSSSRRSACPRKCRARSSSYLALS